MLAYLGYRLLVMAISCCSCCCHGSVLLSCIEPGSLEQSCCSHAYAIGIHVLNVLLTWLCPSLLQ